MTPFKSVLFALLLHASLALAATTNTFPADGNVGIGVTSPSTKLHLGNNSVLTIGSDANSTQQQGLVLMRSTSGMPLAFEQGKVWYTTGGIEGNETLNFYGRSVSFLVGPTISAMAIRGSDGNVGIGTANPTAKLTVIGTISAKEVKVTTTGFPDYVFDEDYKLRTLDEVEAHIKEHKHLPGIPSAAEVERDGLALSDISKKQMEKIEELTLYMIELKKQNEELKKSNAHLLKRVEALEQK